MSSQLSPIDLTIVAVYIAGTTLLGAWFTRRQKDVRTYFVGDRNVAWWLVLISIVATETSTVTFLSIPGKGFSSDLTFLQLTLGYIVGRMLIAWLLLPQYLRGELFSAYQLLKERFDVRVQRTASGLFLITRTVADGLRLWLTGLLLQQFTGWDITTGHLVLGIVTLIYTYLGGMEAVIWTDFIQFIIYLSGAVLAGWFILNALHGWSNFVSINEAAGKFHWLEWRDPLHNAQTFWTGLIGGAFVTMASHGADQNMVQRYLCARSLRDVRAALVLSGVRGGGAIPIVSAHRLGPICTHANPRHDVAGRHAERRRIRLLHREQSPKRRDRPGRGCRSGIGDGVVLVVAQ